MATVIANENEPAVTNDTPSSEYVNNHVEPVRFTRNQNGADGDGDNVDATFTDATPPDTDAANRFTEPPALYTSNRNTVDASCSTKIPSS